MIPPRSTLHRFFLAFSLPLMGAAWACGSTAPIPPSTSVPFPATPTATVLAARFLYATDDLPLEVQSEAQAWAESHDLAFTVGPAGEITPARIGDGLAFVVSLHGAEWATDPAFDVAGVRGVAVDPSAPALSRLVSGIAASRETWGEAGFLAGVLAGLIGDSRAVGMVAGSGDTEQADALADGFDQGLRYACPRCLEVQQGTASLDMGEFLHEGVEVVFVAPSDEAVEAARAAADAGLWVVWLGEPPLDVPGDYLAASVRLDSAALLSPALDALAAGEDGVTWPYSTRSGSLMIGDVRSEAISPGKQRLVQQAWDKLARGELQLEGP